MLTSILFEEKMMGPAVPSAVRARIRPDGTEAVIGVAEPAVGSVTVGVGGVTEGVGEKKATLPK